MARYVSKAKRGPKKSKVIIFLNIVIGMLAALCLFMLIGFFTTDNSHYYDRGFNAYYISDYIHKGDYAPLLIDYYDDYGILGMVEEGSEEEAALAGYADAAFRYNAYLQAGDSERAAVQKARMEEAAKEVGIYEPELAKIGIALNRE